jgi:hypothetical protein
MITNLYRIILSCSLAFKKIIYFILSKNFKSPYQSKLALMRVYIILYLFFIQLILLLILQLIFINIFGTYSSECEGSFLGNMIIANENTGCVEIWIHRGNSEVTNPSFIISNGITPVNSGPLFFPIIDTFNPVAEANTLFDRYFDTLSSPNSRKRVIECIIDSLPSIETSSVFNRNSNHSYLVLKELYNLSYLNPGVRIELLYYIQLYNIYVDCGRDNLSTMQAANFIEHMPMNNYMLEYQKVQVNMHSYIEMRYTR